jgi:hypothetical protein
LFLGFDIVKKYMSLWVKYVLIIEPTSDLTLDDFDGQSELLEGRSQRCQAYLNKFKEGETKDVLKNQDCVDIAQLYSTEMFRMPTQVKIATKTIIFYSKIVKALGSVKYM